jgi:hypothetical protein
MDTNSERQIAPVFDAWTTSVREGTHTHDGDAVVSDHARAVHRAAGRSRSRGDDGRQLLVPVKGDDRAKIDGALADMLARHAALSMAPAAEPVRAGPAAASW